MEHPAASFYRLQMGTTLCWWLLVRKSTGKTVEEVARSEVITRPAWLPVRLLRVLHAPRVRKGIFLLPLAGLGAGVLSSIGGSAPPLLLRVGVALALSVYHLLENSTTNRHGEFPMLHNAWAMCFASPRLASAASKSSECGNWRTHERHCTPLRPDPGLGIAINFVLSSGVSKLLIGGRRWLASSTMRAYLSIYCDAAAAPPLSKTLNRWARQRPWATASISVATVALECGLIPLTLVMPPRWRALGTATMVCMHVGIAALMSFRVGLVFFTTFPAYVVGFRCAASPCTPEWMLAALVAFVPSVVSIWRQKLLPDIWPCSSISLFMWSGEQAEALAHNLMLADLRVVMCTDETWSARGIMGLPVLHHGGLSKDFENQRDRERGRVHDVVLRAIGFTLVLDGLLDVCPSVGDACQAWDVKLFCHRLQQVLTQERRLIEMQSGRPLTRVFFVRIDDKQRVCELLSHT